jgi:hypothetical protein
MKNKMSFIVGAVALTAASISAQAQPAITGQINFTGGATVDYPIAGTPNEATTLSSFVGPGNTGGPLSQGGSLTTGAYGGIPGATPSTFISSFDFAAFYAAYQASTTLTPIQLWSLSFNGESYSFDVNTVTVDVQQSYGSVAFLNISGMGTGYITGTTTYAPTPETWSITGTTASGGLNINIGDSNVAVPEPTTLAFGGLGGLLSIVTLIRRK